MASPHSVERVLVVGGGSEIGRAIVRALRDRHPELDRVVLAGRPGGSRDQAARDLSECVETVSVVDFDALETDSHDAWAATLHEQHGPFDVVIFAHGILPDQLASERSGAEAARSIQTNLTGTVSAMVPLANQMAERGQGTLVALSTIAALRPRRDNFVYGAGKAGLDAFARGLGGALEDSGVGVLTVRLGFVHTRMTEGMAPAPLASTPDVIAERVARAVGRRGATVIYAPPLMRVLATVLKLLPQPLLDHMARGRMPN
jgi:decaprenylphospho-beta-D-erythro-pentofuranosid-2-ulose 2-reductase